MCIFINPDKCAFCIAGVGSHTTCTLEPPLKNRFTLDGILFLFVYY